MAQEQTTTSNGQSTQRPRRYVRRPRYRRKVCPFCIEGVKYIDYKNPDALRPYLDEMGKILGRRKTGVCAKHQRRLAVAIKRARHLALLPFAPQHVQGQE